MKKQSGAGVIALLLALLGPAAPTLAQEASSARNFQALIEQAQAAMARGNVQEGTRLLERITAARPDDARGWFFLGHAYLFQEKVGDAGAAFKRAIAVDPGFRAARAALANLSMDTKGMMTLGLDDSIEQFRWLIAHSPPSPRLYERLGLTLHRKGKTTAAESAFTRGLTLGTLDGKLAYEYAVLLHRTGRFSAAARHAEDAVRAHPEDLGAAWLLHLTYRHLQADPPAIPPYSPFPLVSPPAFPGLVPFDEMARTARVDKRDAGRGSGWADVNQDGWVDLVAAGSYQPLALYRNNRDGTFTEITEAAGIRGGDAWGTLLADYDNDGDPDLYVTRGAWGGPGSNTLFRNTDGRFTDVTAASGVENREGSSFAAAWGDLDNDGWVDLYVANGAYEGPRNVYFHNNGNGTFTDRTTAAGLEERGASLGTALGDYDRDGDLDVFVTNVGADCRLYRNDGAGKRGRVTFTDVTATAGVSGSELPFMTFFLDYNQDGWPDLFLCTHSDLRAVLGGMIGKAPGNPKRYPVLYRNNRDGTFTDVTREVGLGRNFGSMATTTGDFNNDGWPDIFLQNGGPEMGRLEPDTLFINVDGERFQEVGAQAGVDHLGKGHGASVADYDRDGDVDLYAPYGGAFEGDQWPNRLFRNRWGDTRAWLRVRLVGTRSNRDAIGAVARLRAGGRDWYQTLDGGHGFGCTSERVLHFGLANRDGTVRAPEYLEITWPSGTVQRIDHPKPRQVLEVVEPDPAPPAAE